MQYLSNKLKKVFTTETKSPTPVPPPPPPPPGDDTPVLQEIDAFTSFGFTPDDIRRIRQQMIERGASPLLPASES